jgi:hypothetical protein
MPRMTREFSLVLVGSGILTAGYFLYPDDDLEAKQQEQVQQQLAGNNNQNNQGHRRSHVGFIWIHTGAWGPAGTAGRPVAMGGGSVSRGGFGNIGRGSVGG